MPERVATWTQAGLVGLIILLAWVPQLALPLLGDETGTYWVIAGGAGQVWQRSFPNAQSILYCHLIWALASLAGSTAEWVLRLPSLLASIGTLVALYRLGGAALGPAHRFLVPLYWLLFLNPPGVPPSLALLARPYAVAMCAGAWSLYALHAFLTTGSRRWLIGFALLAGVTPWFSFFFLLPLSACAAIVVFLAVRRSSISLGAAAGIIGLWVIMTAPLAPQLWATAREAQLHSVADNGRRSLNPAAVWVEPSVALGLFGALAVSLATRRRPDTATRELHPDLALCAVSIAFLSVAPLDAGTRLTGTYLAPMRYLCLAFAPLALLYGALLVRQTGALARTGAVALSAAMVLGPEVFSRRSFDLEMSRSYPQLIAEIEHERGLSLGKAKLYLTSDFVEGSHARFPQAESQSNFLAPYIYYKLSEPYQLLPDSLDQGSQEWAASLVDQIRGDPVFIFAGPHLPSWLGAAIAPTHSMRVVTKSQAFLVAVFKRR